MMSSITVRTPSVEGFAEEASAQLGEPVLAAQQFYPRGYTQLRGLFVRLIRPLLGKARLDDHLPQVNVLVVTGTRVAVFGVRFSYGSGVTLTGPHGAWQRSAVSATTKRVKVVSGGGSGSTPRTEQSFLRLSLHTPDGELGADMLSPGSRRTRELARALAGTSGPRRT
jgi:hypothetical protein